MLKNFDSKQKSLEILVILLNFCDFLNICVQSPKGRDVEDDDSFIFNEGFTAPLYRIKVQCFECLVIQWGSETDKTILCLLSLLILPPLKSSRQKILMDINSFFLSFIMDIEAFF